MREDLRTLYGEERLPRYTSYPSSPHFSAAADAGTYADWLRALPAAATASLYLHVPFCRSMCWYCGCHTSITRHDAPIRDYVATSDPWIQRIDTLSGVAVLRQELGCRVGG